MVDWCNINGTNLAFKLDEIIFAEHAGYLHVDQRCLVVRGVYNWYFVYLVDLVDC